jgi:hypothetical protein
VAPTSGAHLSARGARGRSDPDGPKGREGEGAGLLYPFSFILNFLIPFPFVFSLLVQIQTCSKFKFK